MDAKSRNIRAKQSNYFPSQQDPARLGQYDVTLLIEVDVYSCDRIGDPAWRVMPRLCNEAAATEMCSYIIQKACSESV